MNSGLTPYAEQRLLDQMLNGVALTFPTQIWVALHAGDPGEDASANEVAEAGYVRARVHFNSESSPKWRLAAAGLSGYAVKNEDAVAFGPAGADWGTVTDVSFWDDAAAGHAWWVGTLSAPVIVLSGGTLTFGADQLASVLRRTT